MSLDLGQDLELGCHLFNPFSECLTFLATFCLDPKNTFKYKLEILRIQETNLEILHTGSYDPFLWCLDVGKRALALKSRLRATAFRGWIKPNY
jgi:hypothetical protein